MGFAPCHPRCRVAAPLVAVALAVAPLLPGASTAAPAPSGYFVDSTQAKSAPPASREEKTGDYICTIERQAPDAAASRLLGIAESVYPPRSLLTDMAAENGYEIGADTMRVPLWWCHGTAERRVPYAATRGALEHYLKLTEKYRDRERRGPGMQPIFSSELIYRAMIARREEFAIGDRSFDGAYVASLGLSWTYDDGTFLSFVGARRTVVLSARGEILAVDGDGGAVEDVSISSHRDVGRQKQLYR
jgi:hypothetical protein